jgi:hypothetical protein
MSRLDRYTLPSVGVALLASLALALASGGNPRPGAPLPRRAPSPAKVASELPADGPAALPSAAGPRSGGRRVEMAPTAAPTLEPAALDRRAADAARVAELTSLLAEDAAGDPMQRRVRELPGPLRAVAERARSSPDEGLRRAAARVLASG